MAQPKTLDAMLRTHAELKKLRREVEADFDRIARENRAAYTKAKKISDGTDLAADLIFLFKGLAGLTAKAYRSTKLSGEALVKLNNEVVKDLAKDKTQDIGKKFYDGQAKDRMDEGWLKKMLTTWADLTRPSFWAAAWIDVVENRNFTFDPNKWDKYADRIYKDSQSRVDAIRKETLKRLDAKIKDYERLIRLARAVENANLA